MTRIDIVMRATDQAVEILFECARTTVGTGCAQVRGSLAVAQAKFAQFRRAKRLDAVGFDLADEHVEPVPVILALIYPEV